MLIQKIKFINVLLGKNLDPYFLWTFTLFTQTTYQWWKWKKGFTFSQKLQFSDEIKFKYVSINQRNP